MPPIATTGTCEIRTISPSLSIPFAEPASGLVVEPKTGPKPT